MENHGYRHGLLKTRPFPAHRILDAGMALCILMSISGCDFDKEWEENIAFPATLEISNQSGQRIDLREVYSTPDAEGAFAFYGRAIPAGESMSIRIPEVAYEIIMSGQFELVGSCGGDEGWHRKGHTLKDQTVPAKDMWKVSIHITDCSE